MKRLISIIICCTIWSYIWSQNATCYRIYLQDKAGCEYTIDNATAFLSPRAIEKRERFNIQITEQDLPVSNLYLQNLKITPDIQILSTSKWLNTVVLYCPDSLKIDEISQFPFVDSIIPVANYQLDFNNLDKKISLDNNFKSYDLTTNFNYANSIEQIAIHNGHLMHEAGFCGDDMLIAVLDGGWDGFDYQAPFFHFYLEGRIWGTRDFVPNARNVYNGITHGTQVTAIMGANLDGEIIGSAPHANFFFIRSENPYSEQPIEEDFWVAGAELADSLGADVINSSLGYTTFPDFPQATFTINDNNGRVSVASKAATIAVEKGIVVVISAGNEGTSEWQKIGRPADAFNVLAVGACNKDSLMADFSSHGFSADGRVKPDVCAVGWDTWSIYGIAEDSISYYILSGNGTSFSGPVIAGMAACLWQALPHKSASELMQIIRESGHLYATPDTLMGYGIPNIYQAYLDNQEDNPTNIVNFAKKQFIGAPNPCSHLFKIYGNNEYIQSVKLYDLSGRELLFVDLSKNPKNQYILDLSNLKTGFYIAEVQGEQTLQTIRIIKK